MFTLLTKGTVVEILLHYALLIQYMLVYGS